MPRVSRRFRLSIVLIAVVVAALVYGRYRFELAATRQRLAGASEIATTPCGPIEYAGVGAGPPILVVHGAGGGFDQGLLMAEGLVSAGYQAIAVSRFGYLRTPLPADASPTAQADAHACLLDALRIERVAVLGASAGAPSSLELAIRHPERVTALILLVPATYLPESGGAGAEVPPGLQWLFRTALRWDLPFWVASKIARPTLIRSVLGTPPELLESASAEERRHVANMLDFVLPVSERRLGLLNEAEVTTTLQRFALARIRAPTLIISAEDDLYGTFERGRYTATQIPGATFVGYPSGGHLLVGREAETTAEMVGLLQRALTAP